ncbi:hypothetical protein ACXIVK_31140, partial [Paraburkholderia caledonica]
MVDLAMHLRAINPGRILTDQCRIGRNRGRSERTRTAARPIANGALAITCCSGSLLFPTAADAASGFRSR